MATDVPQRDLRNRTAELLRRVEQGERLRITVHGHPVAELVPVERPSAFVSADRIRHEFASVPPPDDALERDLGAVDDEARDPYA